MSYWVVKKSKFPTDKDGFHCAVALSKSNVFFVDLLQI